MGIELKGTFTDVEAPASGGLLMGTGDMRKDQIMCFIVIVLSGGMNEPRAYRVTGYTFISESELEELRRQRRAAAGSDCGEDMP